jgi:arylsulfatase A-like enzyme
MQKIGYWVKDKDGDPELKGKGIQGITVQTTGIHGNKLEDWVRQYHQGVLAIDEGIGKVLKSLKDSGQFENTLVVFTSDQGFGWGQHGFRSKLAPYDATIRSPMIVRMPGKIPAGSVCDTPVGGTDLVPTFFSQAGIDVPWKMHGHDISPLLANPKHNWPHPVLTTLTSRRYGKDCDRVPTDPKLRDISGVPWWVSLRKGKYKYIRTLVKGELEELYDLESDPEELLNLATRREHQQRVEEFRRETVKELRRTDAKMVDHLPAVANLKEG